MLEDREDDARRGVRAVEAGGAVEGDDGLADAAVAGDTGGAGEGMLDEAGRGGVEEDRPALPRLWERDNRSLRWHGVTNRA